MNQSGNNPHAPQSGQTLVQGGQPQYGAAPQYGAPQYGAAPQYVPASPPGVAVALPNAQHPPQYGQPQPQYGQPQPQYGQPQPQYGQPQYGAPQQPQYAPPQQPPPHAQPQQAAPSKPKGSGRENELLQNTGRTVYEFRGEHSEEARSGGRHHTFFADDTNLASVAVTDDRQHSNLKSSGASSWIIGGIVIATVGALTAFFLVATPKDDGAKEDEKEAAAKTEAPAPAPVDTPPVDPAATPPVDPAAAGGTVPATTDGATPPPAPAEGTKPAEEAKPAEETKPAEEKPAEPTKKSTTTKKKSTKKTEPKEEEKKTPSITPSKPPRNNGLDGLPAPE